MRPLKLTPQETPQVTPQEPLRTLDWIREHVLGNPSKSELSDTWIKKNLPSIRLGYRIYRFREGEVRNHIEKRYSHYPQPEKS